MKVIENPLLLYYSCLQKILPLSVLHFLCEEARPPNMSTYQVNVCSTVTAQWILLQIVEGMVAHQARHNNWSVWPGLAIYCATSLDICLALPSPPHLPQSLSRSTLLTLSLVTQPAAQE